MAKRAPPEGGIHKPTASMRTTSPSLLNLLTQPVALLLLLFSLGQSGQSWAADLTIDPATANQPLVPAFEVLEDPQGALSFDAVSRGELISTLFHSTRGRPQIWASRNPPSGFG